VRDEQDDSDPHEEGTDDGHYEKWSPTFGRCLRTVVRTECVGRFLGQHILGDETRELLVQPPDSAAFVHAGQYSGSR
jgi:hypothetical protein